MKRIASLIVAVICTTGLFAQTNKIPTIKEIVSIENENTTQAVQIVNIPVDGINHYWLHVGSMGIGNKVIQVELDPFDQTLFKEPKGTMREIQGSFKPFFPGENLETIQVYKHKPLLTNQLQFVIERDGYERVAYLSKSDFNALLKGLKFHGKLNPSEM